MTHKRSFIWGAALLFAVVVLVGWPMGISAQDVAGAATEGGDWSWHILVGVVVTALAGVVGYIVHSDNKALREMAKDLKDTAQQVTSMAKDLKDSYPPYVVDAFTNMATGAVKDADRRVVSYLRDYVPGSKDDDAYQEMREHVTRLYYQFMADDDEDTAEVPTFPMGGAGADFPASGSGR